MILNGKRLRSERYHLCGASWACPGALARTNMPETPLQGGVQVGIWTRCPALLRASPPVSRVQPPYIGKSFQPLIPVISSFRSQPTIHEHRWGSERKSSGTERAWDTSTPPPGQCFISNLKSLDSQLCYLFYIIPPQSNANENICTIMSPRTLATRSNFRFPCTTCQQSSYRAACISAETKKTQVLP